MQEWICNNNIQSAAGGMEKNSIKLSFACRTAGSMCFDLL